MHCWVPTKIDCKLCSGEHTYLIRVTAGLAKIRYTFKCKNREFEQDIVLKKENSFESTFDEMEVEVDGQSTQEIPTVQGKEQGQVKDVPKVPS